MNKIFRKFKYYISDFHTIWIIFATLIVAGILAAFGLWGMSKYVFFIALSGFFIYIAVKPMNAVYALNGTSGNITKFIILIIVFNFIFSLIYFWGFFKNAGISYDINQPYVSYGMFKNTPRDSLAISFTARNTINGMTTESKSYYISQKKSNSGKVQYDTIVFVSPSVPIENYYYEEHVYNHIKWWPTVFQNTLLTSLMQEPTDLFSCCSVYNDINSPLEQNLNGFDDEESCRFFTWILLVQVFISWIFFGVFISILYNKFRYES